MISLVLIQVAADLNALITLVVITLAFEAESKNLNLQ